MNIPISFLITLAIALCSTSAWPRELGAPGVQEVDIAGIRNYSQIEGNSGFTGPLIGFGGATQPSAMALLRSRGFASVIDLRLTEDEDTDIEANRAAAMAVKLEFIHLPFDVKNPAPDLVERYLAALGNPARQPVFTHCSSATRAAALWMIARVQRDGMSFAHASAEASLIAEKPDQAIAFARAWLDSTQK